MLPNLTNHLSKLRSPHLSDRYRLDPVEIWHNGDPFMLEERWLFGWRPALDYAGDPVYMIEEDFEYFLSYHSFSWRDRPWLF